MSAIELDRRKSEMVAMTRKTLKKFKPAQASLSDFLHQACETDEYGSVDCERLFQEWQKSLGKVEAEPADVPDGFAMDLLMVGCTLTLSLTPERMAVLGIRIKSEAKP